MSVLEHTFSLGGVAPHDDCMLEYQHAIEPVIDAEPQRANDGSLISRAQWRKSRISLNGSGWIPLHLGALDYSGPLALVITTQSAITGDADGEGIATWQDQSFTVLTRGPSVTYNHTSGKYDWSLECEEVDATVLFSPEFTFELGGASPHALAMLEFQQDFASAGGSSVVRMADGSAEKHVLHQARQITISGSGWVPIALGALNYTVEMVLTISRLNSVDGDGNPVYIDTDYDVLTDPPSETWDMIARLYRWQIVCVEA